jgi:GDP-4-dehydro-6-deoxy-D-mannose reductase
MTDVRDVARAYRLLADHGRSGEAYNVGSGVSRRSGDIFEQLRQMHDPQRSYVELFPGRRQDPIVDLTKTKSLIRWRPEIPLAATLRDTLDYWIAVQASGS